jgi:hypothetical protein
LILIVFNLSRTPRQPLATANHLHLKLMVSKVLHTMAIIVEVVLTTVGLMLQATLLMPAMADIGIPMAISMVQLLIRRFNDEMKR